jgi:hypothetical protein
MPALFQTTNEWLSVKPRNTTGIRILQIFIGLMICFRIGTELPFAEYLWGPNGISTTENSQHYFGVTLGTVFDKLFFSSMMGVYTLIIILFFGALSLIFNFKTRVAAAICGFAFIMLETRLPAINDGGDNIMRLTLIYMVLLTSDPLKENISKVKIWINNIGVAAIILQLMILYETSGFLKASGEKWQNGTAMYVISNVEWFSLPGFRELFTNPYFTTVVTYSSMFFMIFFPIAIFSRFKFLWIFIGILMHIGIAYSMGLITFSTVMIGLELSLITDEEYKKIREVINNSWVVRRLYPKVEPALVLFKSKINTHE